MLFHTYYLVPWQSDMTASLPHNMSFSLLVAWQYAVPCACSGPHFFPCFKPGSSRHRNGRCIQHVLMSLFTVTFFVYCLSRSYNGTFALITLYLLNGGERSLQVIAGLGKWQKLKNIISVGIPVLPKHWPERVWSLSWFDASFNLSTWNNACSCMCVCMLVLFVHFFKTVTGSLWSSKTNTAENNFVNSSLHTWILILDYSHPILLLLKYKSVVTTT